MAAGARASSRDAEAIKVQAVNEQGGLSKAATASDATAIVTLSAARQHGADHAAYNLAGQRVDDSYRGVVIADGKKFIRK